ncbi:MAG: site-2 protease family protein [Candidatus Woesearchaeota archaeon]
MMDVSILFQETTLAILFVLVLGVYLFVNRKNVEIQKWISYVVYMVLYRAKWGIPMMDSIAKKYPRLVKYTSYSGIYIGFAGMIFIFIYLIYMLIQMFVSKPDMASVAIVQPFVETEFGSAFFYVPFTYFIVAIFIIAVVHEAAHGIVARRFKMKVKSTGFAFFSILVPIIPAAFVEPDEKHMKKAKPMHQLAMYAAGPLANIILGALVLIVLLVANPMIGSVTTENVMVRGYIPGENETMYPAEQAEIGIGELIYYVNDTRVETLQDFMSVMSTTQPGQIITLTTNATTYDIQLAASPDVESGYLGVMVAPISKYDDSFKETYGFFIPIIEWVLGLLLLLFIFNIGVALINLAPIGPLDGGRMMLTVLLLKFKEKEALKIWGKVSLITLVVLLANIFLPMFM